MTGRQLNHVLIIRVCWRGQLEGRTHPSFAVHSVEPEPGWPVGRKGLMLASLWRQVVPAGSDGMLICDGDVVIDPHDMAAMTEAACGEPDAVHTAPVKLWPRATGFPDWVWAHAPADGYGQADVDDPVMFSFGFTFLPAWLIDRAIKDGLDSWHYPNVDRGMWQTARDYSVPVRVVRDCHPRHLNY